MIRRSITTFVANLAGIVLLIALLQTLPLADENSTPSASFEKLELFIEFNATDNNAEIVLVAESQEGIKHLSVQGPSGQPILSTATTGNVAKLGLGDIALESAEPSIKTVLQTFPKGRYTFRATTTTGTQLAGTAILSHRLLSAPSFTPSTTGLVDAANAGPRPPPWQRSKRLWMSALSSTRPPSET